MTRKSGIAIMRVSDFNGDAAQQLREYRLSINQRHILVYAAGSKQPIQGATVKVGGKAYQPEDRQIYPQQYGNSPLCTGRTVLDRAC